MANQVIWKPADTVAPADATPSEAVVDEEPSASKTPKTKVIPPAAVTIHVGDTVVVQYKLIEKEKVSGKTKREVHEETHERTQAFEGIVLAIRGSAENTMVTVRHIGAGTIGIERIFPLVSPWIKKIEVKKTGTARRAKLYYLRHKKGREALRVNETDEQAAATR